MPIITDFSGGLITGADPIYLGPTQSSILLDAKIDRVGMQSELLPKNIGLAEKSFYQFPVLQSEPQEYHITSSSRDRTYTEFQNKLLYSDGGPVCKSTAGEIDPETGDFIWDTIGIEATEGFILAKVLTVDDIAGGSITLVPGAAEGDGYIEAVQIRYRVVDANDTVYIQDIFDNPGHSKTTVTMPSAEYKVYRELLDSYGGYTDQFMLVGQGSFVDGEEEFNSDYTYIGEEEVPNFSGHRLSLLNGRSYSSPYKVVTTDTTSSISISSLYSIDVTKVWASYPIDIQITTSIDLADITGIASTFTYNNIIYIMVKLGKTFQIHSYVAGVTTKIVSLDTEISDELFKGTTVEYGNVLYMFNLIDGKVARFNGHTFEFEDFTKFPYAKAEDTVFALNEGTNEVYAIINNRNDANIRKLLFNNPGIELELIGDERIEVPLIRGLGGTSGSFFREDEFVVFPIHDAIIKYSPITNMVSNNVGNATRIPTYTKSKGFTVNTLSASLVTAVYTDLLADKANLGLWENDLGNVPEWFNQRTLSGTIMYNVAQKTPDGLSEGPIMYVGSAPINLYKGHVIVDLTNVAHTQPLRLYRTGGYLTRYTMVEDVDPTTSYIDKRDDSTIALGRNGSLDYAYSPPEGTQFLTEHNGMLFGAVDNIMYWTLAGQLNAWDKVSSYVILDRVITGLASCVNGLVIFMRGRSKLLTGKLKEDFALRPLSNSKGTVDSRSIQAIDNGVLFFSEDGLCYTDGSVVQELSYLPLGNQKFNVIDSMVTNRSYYALLKEYNNSSLKEAKVILRLDYGGEQPVFTLLSGDGIDGLGSIFGQLAHSASGSLFETIGESERVLNYKSGGITEGLPTMIKEFDRVRVSGRFRGILKVFIDDVTVMEETLNITNNRLFNKHVSKKENKGKVLMFELIGVGFVSSIEYSITDRKVTK